MSFVEGDENFYNFYPEQTYVALGNDPSFYNKAALPAKIDKYIEPWVAAGWNKSELQKVSAKPISDNAAMITARWLIHTDDGESVTECPLPGWRYIVVGSSESRKIIAEFEAPCADNLR